MKPNKPDTIGTSLKDILRRLRILETAPQLTKASIKDGALRVLDAAFGVRVKVGRLDGDFDLDGDDDWGIAIFDDADDIVFLGTKAGLFVKGIVTASIISGSTITGSDIQTAEPPNPRVRITNEVVNGFNAVIQFFHGAEAADAQGYLAQIDYPNGGSSSAILALGPSSFTDESNTDRPQIALWSRRADGVGNRLIQAITDAFYVDAEMGTFTEDLDVYGTVDAYTGLVVAAVPTRGTVKSGRFIGTTNGAGDLVIPHGLGTVPVGVSLTIDAPNTVFDGSFCEAKLQNLDDTNLNVRIYDTNAFTAVTGVQVGVWWMVSNL